MSEKPILFNTEMVRAILKGRKTVTRRVVKPHCRDGEYGWRTVRNKETGKICYCEYTDEWEVGTDRMLKPPYQPGDILYVREAYADIRDDVLDTVGTLHYKADATPEDLEWFRENGWKWRPSIYMPKAAARIWLRVTDVRVERLQEITVAGCIEEGIYDDYKTLSQEYHDMLMEKAYPETFAKLWDSTIKKKDLPRYGWDANPWVWIIEFERTKP